MKKPATAKRAKTKRYTNYSKLPPFFPEIGPALKCGYLTCRDHHADQALRNDYFLSCERRDMPCIIIRTRRLYATVECDLISCSISTMLTDEDKKQLHALMLSFSPKKPKGGHIGIAAGNTIICSTRVPLTHAEACAKALNSYLAEVKAVWEVGHDSRTTR